MNSVLFTQIHQLLTLCCFCFISTSICTYMYKARDLPPFESKL